MLSAIYRCLDFLSSFSADLQNRQSCRGWTPLHLGAYLGSSDGVIRWIQNKNWHADDPVRVRPSNKVKNNFGTCSALGATATEGVVDRNGRSVDDLKKAATRVWSITEWLGSCEYGPPVVQPRSRPKYAISTFFLLRWNNIFRTSPLGPSRSARLSVWFTGSISSAVFPYYAHDHMCLFMSEHILTFLRNQWEGRATVAILLLGYYYNWWWFWENDYILY